MLDEIRRQRPHARRLQGLGRHPLGGAGGRLLEQARAALGEGALERQRLRFGASRPAGRHPGGAGRAGLERPTNGVLRCWPRKSSAPNAMEGALSPEQIRAFVQGLIEGRDTSWSEGQVAALAMAIFLNGMGRDEAWR
jgi:hypothetical protein